MDINKWAHQLLNNRFWCQWLNKHYHLIANENCKYLAHHINPNVSIIKNFNIAIKNGYLPVVQYLIENNLVTLKNKESNNPLTWAVQNNQIDVIKYLLHFKNNLIPDIDFIEYLLTNHIKKNNIDTMKLLLNTFDIDLNLLQQVFFITITQENLDLIEYLINTYDLDETTIYMGLVMALHKNKLNAFKILYPYYKNKTKLLTIAIKYKIYEALLYMLDDLDIDNVLKEKMRNAIQEKNQTQIVKLFKPFI